MSKLDRQQMIKEALEQVNFGPKEVSVYLALLSLGSAKGGVLAKKTELNRTTVYDVLEGLIRKGVISKYRKGSQTYFSALDPDRLVSYLDREKEEAAANIEKRKKRLSDLLPQLISLQDITSTRPKVQFFEGEKGMREAYEDTLTSREPIRAYANVQTMHEGLPDFFPEYYKRRADKKIFIQAIVPQNELSIERHKHDQGEMREIRFLPKAEMNFSPEINLYNNKMLIASWKEKMAIIVESKELADLQKLTFDILWQSLPKSPTVGV
ncbi:MAG: helix-turn-helix domain-containing protein [Patescibacteria group bacterium]|nr:helix-turn-helix domain-containing protein [Patescibacteria group bacterium]